MIEEKHCDDYIDDPSQPECLRKFLEYGRAPGHGHDLGEKPKLFATLVCPGKRELAFVVRNGGKNGMRVKVNMASRMGDVGVSKDFKSDFGYFVRVPVEWLKEFSAESQNDKAPRGKPAPTQCHGCGSIGFQGDGPIRIDGALCLSCQGRPPALPVSSKGTLKGQS